MTLASLIGFSVPPQRADLPHPVSYFVYTVTIVRSPSNAGEDVRSLEVGGDRLI